MFFFCLGLFLVCLQFLSWWTVAVSSLALGFYITLSTRQFWQAATASGLAWASIGWLADGRNYGLISQRLAGLLHLPFTALLFALLFLCGFTLTGLCMGCGGLARELSKSTTES